jgi:hypothetical protein
LDAGGCHWPLLGGWYADVMAIIGLDFGTELDAGRKTFGYVPHPWGMCSAVPIVHDQTCVSSREPRKVLKVT